jgi:hypothetical protein
MFQPNWHTLMDLNEQRNAELVHEAQQYRLIKQSMEGRSTRKIVLCRLLIWLGALLVNWGRQLLARYDAMVPPAPALNATTVECEPCDC